ncbi:MAG: hypothetical protein M1827_000682 [Pycnora praestabilis]|nr:MAG: hypothetical protein M1827_000682 [Pycnora praestabilis]
MSDIEELNSEPSRRKHPAPYTPNHPVPTVQAYREETNGAGNEDGTFQQAVDSAKNYWYSDGPDGSQHHGGPKTNGYEQPYSSENHNTEPASLDQSRDKQTQGNGRTDEQELQHKSRKTQDDQDRAQTMANETDPRKKRKNMKHMKRDHGEREVTDPVTHLPVTIHDATNAELEHVPGNIPPAGSEPRTATGYDAKTKSDGQLASETKEEQGKHSGMERMFPPPKFEATRAELARIYQQALTIGLFTILFVVMVTAIVGGIFGKIIMAVAGTGLGGGVIWGLRSWVEKKVNGIWQDQVWEANRKQTETEVQSPTPESTHWLNSLLSSIWPLVNPDLFASLADTLEDVMQASLPKMVRMISVEDLGQGSEAIQILGVSWLPTGAAARSVSVDGRLKSGDDSKSSDREVPGEGEMQEDAKSDHSGEYEPKEKKEKYGDVQKEQEEENIAEGMEGEEGDFVNVEIAFAYRAKTAGKDLKTKAKNAHLYLAFYLPGGLRFPVWVEVRGVVGTLRLRLQLTPDPPFFALCTLTLLGQPKVDLSCVPLTKKGLNIMDLPIISGFVQSSVDAAMAEYVAPKSLTLDLKDMLVGDDFKKDTTSRGILVINIKRAKGFKEGDPGLGVLKRGSSDAYVAVGWAKFGKPVWSTRVILEDMEPIWDETAFLLVGPDELNAEERLLLKLWDSDRYTADDDLGQIAVDLKEIMKDPRSKGKIWHRKDSFQALDADEKMPGDLEWSVGYFAKTKLLPSQLAHQHEDPEINDMGSLKQKVAKEAEGKLREATEKDESYEIEQQKAQMLKQEADKMIISSPPDEEYPSGIFSIQIHQVVGLEFEKIKKNKRRADGDSDDEEEGSGDLPSSYCSVILNHNKIFKTRTKPKNANPFFNAGTERFIRNWQTTEVILSVRDARVHEDDPLLGIVVLPLHEIFKKRSQIMNDYPLVGGIGYGRARISMVFRSVQLQAPRELLGWEYGTLEITSAIKPHNLSDDYSHLRLKIRTAVGKGKMYASDGQWTGNKDRLIRLAVRKRYCSCVIIEFRKSNIGFDKTPAYAVFWLKDIPDDEERTVTLPVWKGSANLKRAEANCDSELGERLGSIEVPMKFWPGLSGYHKKLTAHDPKLKDVVEVLDVASDNREVEDSLASSGSDSDSSDEGEQIGKHLGRIVRGGTGDSKDEHNQNSGSRDPITALKDYRDHRHQLHRQHRGLMQWKGARTLGWMKTKVEHGSDHISNRFKHQSERNSGVQTEV